jgi:hypothetical protein
MAPLLSLTKLGLTAPVPLSRTVLLFASCLKDLGGHLPFAQSNEGYLPAREHMAARDNNNTTGRLAHDMYTLGL